MEILHPEVAGRDCGVCREYDHDIDSGILRRQKGTNEPIRRTAKNLPPCMTERGCPKGTPENQRDFNQRNRWAWRHFITCQAMGRFPDDPLVHQNADLIANALFQVREWQRCSAGIQTAAYVAQLHSAILRSASLIGMSNQG